MKNVGVKKIWIRKNIKKNKKYRLAFDKKFRWGKKKKKEKKKEKKRKKRKKKKPEGQYMASTFSAGTVT